MISMMRALVGNGHGTELVSVWMHTLQCAPSPSLNPRPFADKISWTERIPTTCVGLSACLYATTETSRFPNLPLDSSKFISSSALAQILSRISSSKDTEARLSCTYFGNARFFVAAGRNQLCKSPICTPNWRKATETPWIQRVS